MMGMIAQVQYITTFSGSIRVPIVYPLERKSNSDVANSKVIIMRLVACGIRKYSILQYLREMYKKYNIFIGKDEVASPILADGTILLYIHIPPASSRKSMCI